MDKNIQEVMFSSDDTEWGTPQWLFDILNYYFKFDIDACASRLC